jgi:hypothetical protein
MFAKPPFLVSTDTNVLNILLTLVPATIPWDQLNNSGVDVHCIAGLIKVSGTVP